MLGAASPIYLQPASARASTALRGKAVHSLSSALPSVFLARWRKFTFSLQRPVMLDLSSPAAVR